MKRRVIYGIRSMPCLVITVGVRQELLVFLIRKTFVLRRGLLQRNQRVAFHMAQMPGSHQPGLAVPVARGVFVPRNDFLLRCVKYTWEA